MVVFDCSSDNTLAASPVVIYQAISMKMTQKMKELHGTFDPSLPFPKCQRVGSTRHRRHDGRMYGPLRATDFLSWILLFHLSSRRVMTQPPLQAQFSHVAFPWMLGAVLSSSSWERKTWPPAKKLRRRGRVNNYVWCVGLLDEVVMLFRNDLGFALKLNMS